MTKDTQQHLANEFTKEMQSILFKKRADYANNDVLSNFKNAASVIGVTAETNCMCLIATKVARIANLLLNNKQPFNESVKDSIIDLANYSFLLYCLLIDNNPSTPTDKKTGEDETISIVSKPFDIFSGGVNVNSLTDIIKQLDPSQLQTFANLLSNHASLLSNQAHVTNDDSQNQTT